MLYDENVARAEANSVCGVPSTTDSTFGRPEYLVFLILYSLLCLVALVQLGRAVHYGGCRSWLLTSEMALVAIMAALRALAQAVFYVLYTKLTLVELTFVVALPYIPISWIYTFVISAWASILASASNQGKTHSNPFAPLQSLSICVNLAVTGAFLALFSLMASSTDLGKLHSYDRAGTIAIIVVLLSFGLAFLVYGTLLMRALSAKGSANYLARRVYRLALAFTACFVISGVVQLLTLVVPATSDISDRVYSCVFYACDWSALVIVLLLFARSINDAVVSKRTKLGVRRASGGSVDSTYGSHVQGDTRGLTQVQVRMATHAEHASDADAAAGTPLSPGKYAPSDSEDDEDGSSNNAGSQRQISTESDSEKVAASSVAAGISAQLPVATAADGAPTSPLLSAFSSDSNEAVAPVFAPKSHEWVLLLDLASVGPGDQVEKREQMDENGLPFQPPVFQHFVLRAQPSQAAIKPATEADATTAAAAAARLKSHEWMISDESELSEPTGFGLRTAVDKFVRRTSSLASPKASAGTATPGVAGRKLRMGRPSGMFSQYSPDPSAQEAPKPSGEPLRSSSGSGVAGEASPFVAKTAGTVSAQRFSFLTRQSSNSTSSNSVGSIAVTRRPTVRSNTAAQAAAAQLLQPESSTSPSSITSSFNPLPGTPDTHWATVTTAAAELRAYGTLPRQRSVDGAGAGEQPPRPLAAAAYSGHL